MYQLSELPRMSAHLTDCIFLKTLDGTDCTLRPVIKYGLITAAGAYVTLKIVQYACMARYKWRQRRRDYPKDVVILHGLHRGYLVPNLSPFPNKLETYLKMAKIPYQFDDRTPFGNKSKTPWISLNGVDVDDSQLCIEFLNSEFKVDLDSHLSVKQRAVARAFRSLVEDHYFWFYAYYAWSTPNFMLNAMSKMPPRYPVGWYLTNVLIRKSVQKMCYSQGSARFSDEEKVHFVRQDLQALSDQIGPDGFLMGDTPCQEDSTMFGFLLILMWNPGFPITPIFEEFDNLKKYCIRMRERYWPDWDKCVAIVE